MGRQQWEVEVEVEEERLDKIHEALKRFPDGLTASRLAMETKIPITALTKLLGRSQDVLKRSGTVWIADFSDLSDYNSEWTKRDEALYFKKYGEHSRKFYHEPKTKKTKSGGKSSSPAGK